MLPRSTCSCSCTLRRSSRSCRQRRHDGTVARLGQLGKCGAAQPCVPPVRWRPGHRSRQRPVVLRAARQSRPAFPWQNERRSVGPHSSCRALGTHGARRAWRCGPRRSRHAHGRPAETAAGKPPPAQVRGPPQPRLQEAPLEVLGHNLSTFQPQPGFVQLLQARQQRGPEGQKGLAVVQALWGAARSAHCRAATCLPTTPYKPCFLLPCKRHSRFNQRAGSVRDHRRQSAAGWQQSTGRHVA